MNPRHGRAAVFLLALHFLSGVVAAQVLAPIGGTGMDYGKAVTVDGEGNTYLALYFQNTIDLDPGPGVSNLTASSFVDIAFASFDPGGSLRWVHHLRNTTTSPAQADIPHGIALDAETNLYLTGYFSGTLDFDPGPGQRLLTSAGSYDIWTASYRPDGQLRWVQSMGNTNSGNASEERNYDIAVDPSGYSYTAGYFEGSLPVAGLSSAGGQDGIVAAYDPTGNMAWAFCLGSTTNDQVQAVALDGNGMLSIIGSFRETVDFDPGPGVSNLTSIGTGTDLFLARYTTDSDLEWAVRIGGNGFEQGAPGGLCSDTDGNLYFSGRFQQSVDFDPGPGVHTLTSTGSDDFFVASYTSSGTLRWARSGGGNGLDGGHRVRLDAQTNVVACGWFTGNTDFDPGAGTRIVSASSTNGGSDAFVVQYDAQGNLRWVSVLQPPPGNTNFGIAAGLWVDNRQRVHVTGQFYGNGTLYAGGQAFAVSNSGASDCFLFRLDDTGALAGTEIIAIAATDSGLTFSAHAATGRGYTVMASSNLTTWTTGALLQASGLLSVTQAPAQSGMFYRLGNSF